MSSAKEVVLGHIRATADLLELIASNAPEYSPIYGSRDIRVHQAVLSDFICVLDHIENYASWIMQSDDIYDIIVMLNELRNRFVNQPHIRKRIEALIGRLESSD